ncbi:hypothetical protein ABIA68_002105 [Stenotrophomonas rhizophila]
MNIIAFVEATPSMTAPSWSAVTTGGFGITASSVVVGLMVQEAAHV